MLRITIHHCPGVLTVLLEGRLAGRWVEELERCLQAPRAAPHQASLLVDLTGLTSIDDAGHSCLAAMYREGAEFIAPDCLTKGIVAVISRGAARPNGDGHETQP